ncbi:MAG: hypothetical protein H7Y17_16265 [Chlorobia bacterium]|nr:hypothetical protein [Fimbriimonadaceae bacterium]
MRLVITGVFLCCFNLNAEALLNSRRSITSQWRSNYFVLVERETTSSKAVSVYLATKQKGKLFRLVRLETNRLEWGKDDKLTVSGNQIVILLKGAADRYEHYHVLRKGSTYKLLNKPKGATFGGSSVAVLWGYILGTMWVSPDYSESPGNYLYVFGRGGLRFGKLPGSQEGYEVRRLDSHRFQLQKWNTSNSNVSLTNHRFPFAMKNGQWILPGLAR